MTAGMTGGHPRPQSAAPRRGWVLGASTLGAPGMPLSAMARMAAAAGAQCLELRVGPTEPTRVDLTPADRARISDEIASSGLTVLSVASYVRVGAAGDDDASIEELLAHLRLAADLGAPFLRVFPGAAIRADTGGPQLGGPATGRPATVEPIEAVDARIVRRLLAVGEQAAALDVRPVLETHDSHPSGEDIARVLDGVGAAAPGHPAGAIWDVLHPFRVGEPVARTAAILAPYLAAGRGYVQIKDVDSTATLTPVTPGDGVLPLAEILDRLDRDGYRGPVSLEWEKAWYPGIPELSGPLAATRRWLDAHPRQCERQV